VTGGGTLDGPTQTPAPAIPARTADREDWRRVLHAASAVIGPLALRLPGHGGTIALAALAGIALVLEVARHTVPSIQRAVGNLARTVFRPGEERGISGATALAFGYLATWGLFDARSAAAAIVVGGLADPAAALVGSRWGRQGRKSMAGSAACAGTAAVTLLACGYSAAPALMGGVVAAVAERAPWRGADNVLVPLAVGGALSMLGLR
jgi:dolichol kinase